MHSSIQSRPVPAPAAAPGKSGPKRHRFGIISPSRSLGYSLQFICKVYCVPHTIFESAEVFRSGGLERTLKSCTALLVDLQGENGERNHGLLRELVRDRRLDGIETIALVSSNQRLRLPGVREVRLTTASFQLNVGEFDAIISRWKHEDARPQILPAYRELLRRGSKEVELRVDGQHHFWQKLAVLDSDPLFNNVIRHLCVRLGYTYAPYRSPRALVRDIASGMQFAHVIIDQAFDYGGASEVDPSLILSAAAELRHRGTGAAGGTPSLDALAGHIFTAPEILAQRLSKVNLLSVHDQITRILPSIPGVGEVDRMYPSNPLLVNISDFARRLDPTVRIMATGTTIPRNLSLNAADAPAVERPWISQQKIA